MFSSKKYSLNNHVCRVIYYFTIDCRQFVFSLNISGVEPLSYQIRLYSCIIYRLVAGDSGRPFEGEQIE